MDTDKDIGGPSPWQPETDPYVLKLLGKLAEECGELSAAVARCIIQGIDEAEPTTGKPNRRWLEEELADVLANIDLTMTRLDLDHVFVGARRYRKYNYLAEWLGPVKFVYTDADVAEARRLNKLAED